MSEPEVEKLQVGVLGCGPISQAAHFDALAKASNAELYAICDVAQDLRSNVAAAYGPTACYGNYDEMLDDPNVQAVIIATSDPFHVPASLDAISAGKHVLCEKPAAISVREVLDLGEAVKASGLVYHVGHMKRYDAGIQSAREFVENEIGEILGFKGWYCDSTHRYQVTDAVQPKIQKSINSKRPADDPKANLARYYMLAHGSHLIDIARYLVGEIVEVDAKLTKRFGAYSWFIDTLFADGFHGHLNLTVPVRMDWHEGFEIFGENGSVIAKTYNPWLFKSTDVEIFRERDASTIKPLGADGHFYRRQVEGFAAAVFGKEPENSSKIDDAIASVRTMSAISQSVLTKRPVRVADAMGEIR